MSGGKNTVLFDDMEMPSVMVPFPKMKIAEIMSGGSQNIHPAFSVGGVEKDVLYISKFQNIVLNDRAYSLPMRDPRFMLRSIRHYRFVAIKEKAGV